MKILYFLSGLAIFNLMAITAFANAPIQKVEPVKPSTIAVVINPTPTPIIVIKQIVKKVTKFATDTPHQTTQNPSSIQAKVAEPTVTSPVAVTGCIITIDGAKYDVSGFRNQHSGGNIFSCGADMSTAFWGRHGQSQLNKMQQFRI